MKYAVSLDWVECYCALDLRAPIRSVDHIQVMGDYKVVVRPYGTRVYKCVAEVSLCDEPLMTICHTPLSALSMGGIMRDNMCHVKIDNYWLYRDDWYVVFTTALRFFRINPIKLSRIDLACDWQHAECGLYAGDLLAGLMKRKYLKIHQPNWRANGTDSSKMNWHSLAFGSKSSPVFTRFYNKSLELQVTGKDYIRETWKLAGLNLTRDVYRVEFQLSDTGRDVVDQETQQTFDIKLEQVISRTDVAAIFFHYAQHYFDIRKANTASRRTNCKPLTIFPTSPNLFTPAQRPRRELTERMDKVVVRKMIEALFLMKDADSRVLMYHSIQKYVESRKSNVLCTGAFRLLLDALHSEGVNTSTLVDEMFDMTREHFTKYDKNGLWIYKIVNDCNADYIGEDIHNLGQLAG